MNLFELDRVYAQLDDGTIVDYCDIPEAMSQVTSAPQDGTVVIYQMWEIPSEDALYTETIAINQEIHKYRRKETKLRESNDSIELRQMSIYVYLYINDIYITKFTSFESALSSGTLFYMIRDRLKDGKIKMEVC